MIEWIIVIIILFGIGWIIIKKMKKKDNYLDLDSRLYTIKNRWEDCCKKISKFFGI